MPECLNKADWHHAGMVKVNASMVKVNAGMVQVNDRMVHVNAEMVQVNVRMVHTCKACCTCMSDMSVFVWQCKRGLF